MEMVTTGVAVVGAKGGCGTTAVAILAGFGLADALAGGRQPVLVDSVGDIAVTLDISDDLAGVTDVAAGEAELGDALWDLVDDADAAASMPAFLGRGTLRCSPGQVAEVTAALVEADFCPVVDCGAGRDAVPLLEALGSGPVLSRLMTLVPTPAAANAAVALGRGGPGARRVLLDLGTETVVPAADFASAFGTDATVGAIPQWQSWLLDRELPAMLAAAVKNPDATPAGNAIRALMGLLLQPLS